MDNIGHKLCFLLPLINHVEHNRLQSRGDEHTSSADCTLVFPLRVVVCQSLVCLSLLCSALLCSALPDFALSVSALPVIALLCLALHCLTLLCLSLLYLSLLFSVLLCSAWPCSVFLCFTFHCFALPCAALPDSSLHVSALPVIALLCSVSVRFRLPSADRQCFFRLLCREKSSEKKSWMMANAGDDKMREGVNDDCQNCHSFV